MKWEYVNLGEIAEFKNGLNFSKEQYGQGIKYISVVDFQDYFSAKTEELAELKEDFINPSYFLKGGDILFVRSNGNKELVGRNLFIEESIDPITFSGFCIRARFTNENVLPKFYAYLFKSKFFRNTLSANAGGTNINNLNQGILSNLNIPKPPLPTQRKIAFILSAYDELIENNLKRIKLLEEKAFLRYSLLDKVEKFKLSDLYDTSSGGTPSRTNAEYFTGDINWFKSKELADSVLLGSEEKITEGAVDKSSAKLFPVGSVIMAMYGATIGMLGILTQPSTTNQACCAIIQKDLIKSNYYILNWLLENREYILSFRMGAAQENISQMIIKNLLISIPKDRDLIQFNKEAEPIYQLVKNIHIQNTKLREARDILLPKLMNGQIEV